jgi:hypothetical protein
MADLIFTCWTTMRAGDRPRLEVIAACDQDARQMAFASCPGALAVSCRLDLLKGDRRG